MPYIKNRNYTAEDIVNDYNEVKENLGKERLGRKEYLTNGTYTRANIRKFFGEWNDFKKAIGERPLVNKKLSKEDVSLKAFELFEKHGKLTAEIMRTEGYAQPAIDRIFGSFGEMMKDLGLPQEAIGKTKQLSDEDFLSDLLKIQEEYGYVNTTLLEKHSSIPKNSFINRYGTFGEACLKAKVRHIGQNSIIRLYGQAMTAFNKVAQIIGDDYFHTEMTFNWLRNDQTNIPMPVDAYFENSNLIVEFHGPHHYDEEFWLNRTEFSNDFEETRRRDNLKKNLVSEKGIRFIEIYDYEKDDIAEVLKELV